jgi:3-isopropylmalate/(R)-2-methylmalate dehydratase small subunit
VWALQQIGVKAVIAPSFGEIFENNALRNGLVAVRLGREAVERLLGLGPGDHVTVDVLGQVVIMPDGERLHFPLDPFRKHCLVHGLDEIEATLELEPEIASYEAQARRRRPWLVPIAPEEQDT